ncbi:hypothetical protein EOZ78_24310, partial [Escherichia coli]|nr:hypothetical protein [Escherichia coli]
KIFIKNTSRISDNHFQANFRLIKNHGFYSDFLACQSKINPFFYWNARGRLKQYYRIRSLL